jgi:hypothetical protein
MASKTLIAPTPRLRLAAALHWLQVQTLERPAVTVGLALALFLASSVLVLTNLVNHDVSWFYYMSQRWLDGARLYVDLIDMNLPLVVYVGVPPAWLAAALGLPAIPTLQLYILAWLLATLAFDWWLLNRLALPQAMAARGLFFLALTLLLFPFFDFGQREHLMLMLVMPYLIVSTGQAAGRAPGRRARWLAGALAGLGLALKPYFILLWLAVMLYAAFTRRGPAAWRRPENHAIALVVALYGLAVVAFTPEYFTVAALALQAYGAFNTPLATLVNYYVVPLALVVVAAWALWRRYAESPELGDTLAVALLALLAGALFQEKGWGYQFYPSNTLLVLLALLVFMAFARRAPASAGLLRLSAAGAGLTALGVVGALAGALLLAPIAPTPQQPAANDVIATIVHYFSHAETRELATRVAAYARPGDTFYAFTPSVGPSFPIVHLTGTRWPTRFHHLWPLPAQYRDADRQAVPFPYHAPAQMGPVERFTFQATIADLRAHPPAVVLVDTVADKQGFGVTTFDYLEYFGQDPDFAAWWAGYRFVEQVGTFRLYTRR